MSSVPVNYLECAAECDPESCVSTIMLPDGADGDGVFTVTFRGHVDGLDATAVAAALLASCEVTMTAPHRSKRKGGTKRTATTAKSFSRQYAKDNGIPVPVATEAPAVSPVNRVNGQLVPTV